LAGSAPGSASLEGSRPVPPPSQAELIAVMRDELLATTRPPEAAGLPDCRH